MNFIEVTIITNTAGAEAVTAGLDDIACGFAIDDPKDLQDLLNAPVKKWDYIDERLVAEKTGDVTVKFYLENDENGKLRRDEAAARINKMAAETAENLFGTLEFSSKEVFSEDWENNWKQYYKPFLVGNRLLVSPAWLECQPQTGQIKMIINPASSFGTGSHATTRLCLEELESMELGGKTMLDAGCGSGILATAGMLLGCKSVKACDVEENAVKATAENLEINGVPKENIFVAQGDFLGDSRLKAKLFDIKYGVITANIVSDVLIAMANSLCEGLLPNGDLILCGIIDERADEVAAAFQKECATEFKRTSRDGWVMLHFKSTKSNEL